MNNLSSLTLAKIGVSTVFVVIMIGLFFVPSALTGPGKVDICHVPPGNPENIQLISVGRPAANAHLTNHDDFLPSLNPNTNELECLLGTPVPPGG